MRTLPLNTGTEVRQRPIRWEIPNRYWRYPGSETPDPRPIARALKVGMEARESDDIVGPKRPYVLGQPSGDGRIHYVPAPTHGPAQTHLIFRHSLPLTLGYKESVWVELCVFGTDR